MYKIIVDSLEKVGICIDVNYDALESDDYDINLQEYVTDSITFITFVLSLEENLGIELPDDMLFYERISSIKALALTLKELIWIYW